MVGSIDMYDGYTFVDVPGRYADDVLKGHGPHAKIKERIFTWKKPILTEDKSRTYSPGMTTTGRTSICRAVPSVYLHLPEV